MTRKSARNLAASVHQRLLNKSKEQNRPFNELLQHFAIERFIYRLSISSYQDLFILKGALMFHVWKEVPNRPTKDIDLLGKTRNQPAFVVSIMKEICRIDVDDGMTFTPNSTTASRITEEAEYNGIRIQIQGKLGNCRIGLQIDIGFGDPVIPSPIRIAYPVLLDFPSPNLIGYTRESSIAEKICAMIQLGIVNSRMKDFYDIWILSSNHGFNGEILEEAVRNTFKHRNVKPNPEAAVFDPSFPGQQDKIIQWQSFTKKSSLENSPAEFTEVAARTEEFLRPIITAIHQGQQFIKSWPPNGPWTGTCQ